MTGRLWALALAFFLDLAIGDPAWLPHPVRLIGRYIAWAEGRLRAGCRRLRLGAVALALSAVLPCALAAALAEWLLGLWGPAPLMAGRVIMAWWGLSAGSLALEARWVRRALDQGLDQGRRQVARIVGRDTGQLSQEEVVKATVETVAENTTDGVVAPMLYFALGGPALLWAFKAASTLDSMVGYLDEKYRDIGWFSARLDDAFNFLPARLAGPLMALCAFPLFPLGLKGGRAWAVLVRDHKNHLSPNCAWTESAAAGALGIQLGGSHRYFGKVVVKPAIGDALRPAQPRDIFRMNALMLLTSLLALALILLAGGLACRMA